MAAFGAESKLDRAKVGNQPRSVKRLWFEMGCQTVSGPDQEPTGGALEVFRSSLRVPEGRVRSMRVPVPARALMTAEPDSSSEPAMRRAEPERVTSLMEVLPCRAARNFWRSARA